MIEFKISRDKESDVEKRLDKVETELKNVNINLEYLLCLFEQITKDKNN